MKPYSQAADELRVLEGQFERLALMQPTAASRTAQPQGRERARPHAARGARVVRPPGRRERALQAAQASRRVPPDPGLKAELGEPMDRDTFASLLTGTSDAAGGVLSVPERFPGVVDLPQLPLGIFDLMTVGRPTRTRSSTCGCSRARSGAAEVGEAASAADIDGSTVTAAQGGLKPESDLTFEEVLEAVKTIAHWIPGDPQHARGRGVPARR
jgi:hypothetical protein